MNEQERDAEIKRLYVEEGKGLDSIVPLVGLSKTAVWERLKKLKVKMRAQSPTSKSFSRRYVPGDPGGCACGVCKKHR